MYNKTRSNNTFNYLFLKEGVLRMLTFCMNVDVLPSLTNNTYGNGTPFRILLFLRYRLAPSKRGLRGGNMYAKKDLAHESKSRYFNMRKR